MLKIILSPFAYFVCDEIVKEFSASELPAENGILDRRAFQF